MGGGGLALLAELELVMGEEGLEDAEGPLDEGLEDGGLRGTGGGGPLEPAAVA